MLWPSQSQSSVCSERTEHSNFSLPEDYPLERASPEPVFDVYDSDGCSNEFVHVFSSTPEQQPYEEEEQDSEQHLKCVGNAPETEETTACLNYISDVFGFTFELQEQDDERAGNCSVLKASNSFVSRSSQLSIEHSMRERRLLWDPGASIFLVNPLNNGSNNDTVGNEYVGQLVSNMVDFSFRDKTDLWSKSEEQYIVLPAVFIEVMLDTPAKPPERYDITDSLPQGILMVVLKAGNSSAHAQFNFLSCNSKQISIVQAIQVTCNSREVILAWQRGAFSLGNFARSALWRNITLAGDKIFEDQHILDSSMKKGIILSGRILDWNPRYATLLHHYFLWEFSMDRVLSKSAVLNRLDLKHLCAQLSLQCHSWYTILAALLQVQYYCLPIVLDCLYPEPVQQLVCYSSLFSSTAMSMSTATTVDMRLVLGSGKIAQEEKYAAAMYQLLKTQIQMSKTSHIWDPGIKFILYELWRLGQKTRYVFRHLLAVKFATHSYTYFSDTAASMYCPPANLIRQRRNIAALLQFSHCILLSSDVCVWDPGIAVIYQQGFHENYNAKNLLQPSQKYLQIREMDIIFITFLPP